MQEEYVSAEEVAYQKFRAEVLDGAELGALSCDELNDRISAWCLKGQEGVSFEQAPKWKARIKRQWKREGKKWALEQRGGLSLPVRSEEVRTALSEFTREEKESSPPSEGGGGNEEDRREEVRREGEDARDEEEVEGVESRQLEGSGVGCHLLVLDNDGGFDSFCAGLLMGISLCLFVFGFTILCLRG
jgi:hypothetical protein